LAQANAGLLHPYSLHYLDADDSYDLGGYADDDDIVFHPPFCLIQTANAQLYRPKQGNNAK
jgi:hypothetical protein